MDEHHAEEEIDAKIRVQADVFVHPRGVLEVANGCVYTVKQYVDRLEIPKQLKITNISVKIYSFLCM